MDEQNKVKSVKINYKIHKELKLDSVQRGISIFELLEEIIYEHYGTNKPPKVSTKETE